MVIKTVFVIHAFIRVSTIDSTGWDAPENERHRMGNEPDNYKSRLPSDIKGLHHSCYSNDLQCET